MKLYYAPGTCALACWIALKWAKADFEVEKADFSSADYRRINPLGAVPALDIGGKRAMTQAGAILAYVAELYPAAHLGADDDALGRFEFNETELFLSGDFHPAFWPYFFPQRYTTAKDKDSLEHAREASFERIDRVMTHLDGLLKDGDHVYRNRRTVLDAQAFVMARWSEKMPKSWKDYPNVARFMRAMQEDVDVKDVLAQSAAH
jgi:glutathione S-transferase